MNISPCDPNRRVIEPDAYDAEFLLGTGVAAEADEDGFVVAVIGPADDSEDLEVLAS